MRTNDRLIVALDVSTLDDAKKLIRELDGVISFYKIGFELFTAYGWEAVELVKKSAAKIFLDLKLHDIPNTVARTASVICDHEIDMFNVHTLGGLEMMKRTRKAVDQHAKKKKPWILGVTVLTSHSEQNLKSELGIQKSLQDQVLSLAQLAKKAGLNGVVSSPQEISLLRKNFQKDFLIVTPGIRLAESSLNDQKRTLTPSEAFHAGANFIVVGRPITATPNPREAAAKLANSIIF